MNHNFMSNGGLVLFILIVYYCCIFLSNVVRRADTALQFQCFITYL